MKDHREKLNGDGGLLMHEAARMWGLCRERKGDSERESWRRYTWGELPGYKGEGRRALKLCVSPGPVFKGRAR